MELEYVAWLCRDAALTLRKAGTIAGLSARVQAVITEMDCAPKEITPSDVFCLELATICPPALEAPVCMVDFSLRIAVGDNVVITGPNGCGVCLIDSVCEIIPPYV